MAKAANIMHELSWAPVRRGPIYCAPACGAHCTIFQFDHAGILANQTAMRLGEGWKPTVHENMGWFAGVVDASGCWKIAIHEYKGEVSFTAFLGDAGSAGGKWAESANTPEAAIEKVKKVARAELKRMQKMIDAGQVESKNLYGQRTSTAKRAQPSPTD